MCGQITPICKTQLLFCFDHSGGTIVFMSLNYCSISIHAALEEDLLMACLALRFKIFLFFSLVHDRRSSIFNRAVKVTLLLILDIYLLKIKNYII